MIKTNESSTIIDRYDGGYMLMYHDLSIKLENDKIIKINDPYEWKQYTVGSQYNYTRYDYISYVYGNQTGYTYEYIGVI